MKEILTQPCRPYDTENRDPVTDERVEPVDVQAIIGRLTPSELRRLAIALAIHRSDVFEERVLGFWAGPRY